MFFKAVVQAVLILGSETWVMTPHIGQSLVGVYHRVAQQIVGRHPWRLLGGIWYYPQMETVIRWAGFE